MKVYTDLIRLFAIFDKSFLSTMIQWIKHLFILYTKPYVVYVKIHELCTVIMIYVNIYYTTVSGYRTCDPQEQYECADSAYFDFAQNFVSGGFEKSCDCPRNCKTMNYDATLSSNTISNFAMTTIAETFFVNKTCEDETDQTTCSYAPDLNTTVANLYNDLVDIQIYFQTLTVEDVSEVPRYTILSLFCDMGGAMGLILGSTVLTIAELGEFLFFLIYDVIFFKISQMYFRLKRQRIQPVQLM